MAGKKQTNRTKKVKKDPTASGFTLRHTLRRYSGPFNSVAWSPDGLTLASASADDAVRLWDAASGKEFRILEGRAAYLFDVAWSSDGLTLASASGNGLVRLWEASSGRAIGFLMGHADFVFKRSIRSSKRGSPP